MTFKIGFGFDVHQLGLGEGLALGGVIIPSNKIAIGHSDADVLIHAICDALLGAAGLRDIGIQFPNTDPQYSGIDSKKLLAVVMEKLEEKQWQIGNVDATVCLESPKIMKYVPAMQEVLSKIMKTDIENVSIKATTNETMGYVGRHEGINAYAVALIQKA